MLYIIRDKIILMVDSNESNVISITINHVSCEKWRLQYVYFVSNNAFIDWKEKEKRKKKKEKKKKIYIYIYI